jgi:hypothetical protein
VRREDLQESGEERGKGEDSNRGRVPGRNLDRWVRFECYFLQTDILAGQTRAGVSGSVTLNGAPFDAQQFPEGLLLRPPAGCPAGHSNGTPLPFPLPPPTHKNTPTSPSPRPLATAMIPPHTHTYQPWPLGTSGPAPGKMLRRHRLQRGE